MLLNIVPVFISSTWLDLGPEREAVREAVLRMRETQFVGMEYFGSRDETTRRASLGVRRGVGGEKVGRCGGVWLLTRLLRGVAGLW